MICQDHPLGRKHAAMEPRLSIVALFSQPTLRSLLSFHCKWLTEGMLLSRDKVGVVTVARVRACVYACFQT